VSIEGTEVATGAQFECDSNVTSASQVSISFVVPPSAGEELTITVIGGTP
jgi:hypothetical protein